MVKLRIASIAICVLMLSTIIGCSPADVVNALVTRNGYTVTQNVSYGESARQAMDWYVPTEATDKPRPLVVFVHGGSWKFGSKDDYLFLGQAFAQRGYVVAIPNYRIYPDSLFPDFIADTIAATRFAIAHAKDYGADPKHVFLIGHSAGAYNVMMAMTYPKLKGVKPLEGSLLSGVVGLSGPYDFLPLEDEILKVIFEQPDMDVTQPITHVKTGLPPVLLVSGDKDDSVSPGNTRRYAKALREKGNRVQEVYLKDVSHIGMVSAFAAPLSNENVLAPVFEFLRTH